MDTTRPDGPDWTAMTQRQFDTAAQDQPLTLFPVGLNGEMADLFSETGE